MDELQKLRAEFEALKAGLAYGQAQQQQPIIQQQPQQPQTVIVEKQVPVKDDAETQRLQREVEQLKRDLANKSNTPSTVVVPVPTPQPNNNKAEFDELNKQMRDLAAQNKALQDKMYEMNNRPQPQPVNTTTTINTRETVVVQEPYSELLKRYPVINVYFATNSSVVKDEDLGKLAEIAGVINKYSESRLSMTGFTDKRGNASYNLQLSKKRADAVKRKLVSYGIDPSKLVVSHEGADESAQPGDNPLARRVELRLTR